MISTRVLVIEDNAADFRLLQEALFEVGAFGIQLTSASLLSAAIAKLKKEHFAVAILDLSLPDTDGLEGLQEIQRVAPDLPVVVLTGRDDSELAVKAVRAGAQDYLVKGRVDGHLLVRAMRYAEERKRNLLELSHSEERFRSLLENALDIIAIIGLEGTVRYASPSVERVLGYCPFDVATTSVASMIHADDMDSMASAYHAVLAGTTARAECRVRHLDGRWRVLEVIGRRVLDHAAVPGIIVNARDITERNEAEERIRDSNDRLKGVIDASPLAIFTVNLDGRVLGWNKAAEAIFGWSEEEVLGAELPVAKAEAGVEFHELLRQGGEGRSHISVESRFTCKDGRVIDVNIWSSPLTNQSGQVTGMVSVVADITERRRLEEQFRQAQKMEAVGRLAGGVAHDFNNLLTVITGYSQLASNHLPEDCSAAKVDLDEVMGAAERAAALTKQLLTLSRRHVVATAIIDLNTVVVEVGRMLHRVLGEDIHLVTGLSPALKKIRADRGQLEMVLLNMAINARDAMPGGGRLTIETDNVELDCADIPQRRVSGMSGSCVMLAISDDGTGMDAYTQAHLFEPFFTTKETGKGTGFGLSTSYGIVRQHGGDIWVYSEQGVGTTFKIYLPVDGESAEGETPKRRSERRPTGTESILIIEDEPSVAGVMRETLELQGYRVLLATEPGQALQIAADPSLNIDLLLSDMVLQSVHGVDLARQIGMLRPGIKVLFVSGYTGAAPAGQPFMEPGVAFLQKPFAPEVLAQKVREVLDQGEMDGADRSRAEG